MIIGGKLHMSFEYTDNILWYIEDDDKLYILKSGDHLKIYDNDDNSVWDGKLEFEPVNKMISGMFINNIQKDVDSKLWINWFNMNFKAVLIRKEI
jgi:hypothetical protein